jgi:hypothetical protein
MSYKTIMAENMNEFDRIRESIARIRAMSNKKSATQGGRLNEDISQLNNQDFQAEKEAFQQAVPGNVEFGNYVNEKDVIELRGELKIGGNGQPLKFVFTTKNKDGLYLECTQFQADTDAIDTVAKLRAYYDVWYGTNLQKLNGSTTNTGATDTSAGGGADAGGGMGGAAPGMPGM